MLKSIIAKQKINTFVEKYFPDSEKHAYDDAESRRRLKETLSWFVDKQDYETLDFFLTEGANLGNINDYATHNFIHGSRALSKENMVDLEFVVNKTKQELENGNDINVKTMLDLFKNSENEEDLDEVLLGSKELSKKMNTESSAQYTNLSPTFVKKYQENKKRLGGDNFSKLKTLVEKISQKDSENARKMFGLTSFFKLDGVDNTENFSEQEITYLLDVVLDVENSNSIGYYSNPQDAQIGLFESGANFISYANNSLGRNKTEKIFEKITPFAEINVSSLEEITEGIKWILLNNEKNNHKTKYSLLADSIDELKKIKTHPLDRGIVCETYNAIKSNRINEYQDTITKAEEISNATGNTTSKAFSDYKKIKEIYSQEFADKVCESTKSLSEKNKKISAQACYLARNLLEDEVFFTDQNNSRETKKKNKKEYSFQKIEKQYDAIIKTVNEIPEKYNHIALTVLINGQFVARDYGYKGLKEVADSLCKLYDYGKGDDFFIAKMTQSATGNHS